MKYQYFYQTKGNEERSGWIAAKNRQDAFTQLRHQGVKPYKLIGDDPVAWRRWTAILVLFIALAGVTFAFLKTGRALDQSRMTRTVSVRAQVYGDPAYLRELSADGFRKAFAAPGDSFLARHAIPGRDCGDSTGTRLDGELSLAHLQIQEGDSEELKKLKRIINGMKDEASAYVQGGGSVQEYALLCCERCRTEQGILSQAAGRFDGLRKKLSSGRNTVEASESFVRVEWEKENRMLRSLGLPTTPFPGEE